MGYKYSIIGSGKQGTASAYDLIKFGESEKILLIDKDLNTAKRSAELLRTLTNEDICYSVQIDIKDREKLKNELKALES